MFSTQCAASYIRLIVFYNCMKLLACFFQDFHAVYMLVMLCVLMIFMRNYKYKLPSPSARVF